MMVGIEAESEPSQVAIMGKLPGTWSGAGLSDSRQEI
jgi:hypothetical protein